MTNLDDIADVYAPGTTEYDLALINDILVAHPDLIEYVAADLSELAR